MKTYKVIYTEKLTHTFYVDAENLDEASEKFHSQLNHGEIDFSDGCLTDSDINIEEDDEDEWGEPDWDDEDYVPSSTRGDYSPSNPWDAPGMKISDFI